VLSRLLVCRATHPSPLLPLPFAWHLTLDKGDSLFSIKMVQKGMARSSWSAAARACCGGGKDEGFILSDEHKLDPLPALPHFRLIHRSS
jgi:hypothetical protein